MDVKSSETESPAVTINEDDSFCQENDRTVHENFKLTFYPDEADPSDREKMQRIWNHIESESRCQEMMVAKRTSKKGKLKCPKNDEKMGKEAADPIYDEKRGTETGMNHKEKTPVTSPETAIALLDRFRELHMIEDRLKKTEGHGTQSDCSHCPSADSFQTNLDDIQSQIKHYEEKLVTQVIGNRRARNSYTS